MVCVHNGSSDGSHSTMVIQDICSYMTKGALILKNLGGFYSPTGLESSCSIADQHSCPLNQGIWYLNIRFIEIQN